MVPNHIYSFQTTIHPELSKYNVDLGTHYVDLGTSVEFKMLMRFHEAITHPPGMCTADLDLSLERLDRRLSRS